MTDKERRACKVKIIDRIEAYGNCVKYVQHLLTYKINKSKDFTQPITKNVGFGMDPEKIAAFRANIAADLGCALIC